MARFHKYVAPENATPEVKSLEEGCYSLAGVKKIMREHGGSGFTEHWVRGGFEGITPISLSANPGSRKSTYKR